MKAIFAVFFHLFAVFIKMAVFLKNDEYFDHEDIFSISYLFFVNYTFLTHLDTGVFKGKIDNSFYRWAENQFNFA